MSVPVEVLADAFDRQSSACDSLGSSQYAALMAGIATDLRLGGALREVLTVDSPDPWRDAIPLRFAAAVHRIVLRGDAPALATRYRSVGGDGEPIGIPDVLSTVLAHADEIRQGLGETVQTNEVGRCAALVPAFARAAATYGLPLNMLELGASAGLLSHWDRYAYVDDLHGRVAGDPGSTVRLLDRWHSPVDLVVPHPVIAREMCDLHPLDPRDPHDRLRLLSFVWPDQSERMELLHSALDVAASCHIPVERADAGEWLTDRLSRRPVGTLTIVFHSIVWQYLSPSTQKLVRSALHAEGARATVENPVAWVRMEPAGHVADVRITEWPGGSETILLTTSYHGVGIQVQG